MYWTSKIRKVPRTLHLQELKVFSFSSDSNCLSKGGTSCNWSRKEVRVVTSLLVQFDEIVPTLASEYQKAEDVLEELKITLNLSDFEYLVGQRTYYQDQKKFVARQGY
jgi:hypothetical protein